MGVQHHVNEGRDSEDKALSSRLIRLIQFPDFNKNQRYLIIKRYSFHTINHHKQGVRTN